MEQEIQLQPELINITAGGGAVDSVNGQTGVVVLTTSDLENTSGYQTSSEVESAISTAVGAEQTAREQADGQLQNSITGVQNSVTAETTARENADTSLQGQIDAITASSDVKDIVGTHAELEGYDTSTLGNNDIIKVLQDETQGGATTYYRWNATNQTFSLIGEEGPYYTKSQTDTLLNAKQDDLTAGSNITISGSTISATDTTYTAGNGLTLTGTAFSADTTVLATQNDLSGKQNTLTAGNNIQITGDTISATDTTYSAFVGTDGTSAGTAGLVPAPATTDADKFLKSDGTWATAGGGGIIELTTADYDYPTDNPGAIALWLLNPGIYRLKTHVKLRLNTADAPIDADNDTTVIFNNSGPNTYGEAIIYNWGSLGSTGYAGGKVVTGPDGARMLGYTNFIIPDLSQSTGNGTAVVMSQNATTGMIFKDLLYRTKIGIGDGTDVRGNNAIGIGYKASTGTFGNSVAVGPNTTTSQQYSVALGYYANATRQGEVNIGSGNYSAYGYNNTKYRVLGGVHDGQLANDAVNVSQINSVIDAINSALSTNISHIGS